VDDRCPDVLAGQRQGLVRLAAQLGVERGVVQRVGEFGRQAGLRQDGLEEGPDAAGLIAARVQTVLGDVDIVVNNAATVTPVGSTASIDPDQWTQASPSTSPARFGSRAHCWMGW
jgi:NAD(P)-dependent dehydrogenase (short-subunit alcohol dehydrogenase family)